VDNVTGFNVGDWVIVRADATADFITDHDMTGWWTTSGQTGPTFYRQILAVNPSTGTLVIDIPTRYWLKTRDNARVYKPAPAITGVGLEDFSIGNAQNTKTGFGDLDYNTSGTGAYDVHASHVIVFRHALNGWMRRVNTYRPSGNASDFHMLSNGLLLYRSRSITVEDCTWSKPQYKGEGGNGYAFTLQGNDCLLKNLVANNTRHNYDFKVMTASGNALVRCTSNTPRLASDFHMHLSMSNLIDSMTLNQDYLDATVRPYGSSPNYHGITTSQSVFWNTKGTAYPAGKSYIINSQQWGWGYIIGTQGAASAVKTTPTSFTASGISPNPVDTAPEDFKEGIGLGTTLVPASLYDDQRARRDATYNVTTDAYVRGGTYATQNFGTVASLMVKNAPNVDNGFDRIAYFKVPFTGYTDPAANAARFYFYSSGTETGAAVPVTVYGLTANSWTETGITWNNQPSMSGAVALGTVTVTAAGWYSIDVSAYVNTRISGDKTATFKLVEETTLNKYANINSREAASNKPYLLITR
jgi:hypothetical protein